MILMSKKRLPKGLWDWRITTMKLKTAGAHKGVKKQKHTTKQNKQEADRRPWKGLGVRSREKEISDKRICLSMGRSFALSLGTRRGVLLLQIAGTGSDWSGVTGRAGGTRQPFHTTQRRQGCD